MLPGQPDRSETYSQRSSEEAHESDRLDGEVGHWARGANGSRTRYTLHDRPLPSHRQAVSLGLALSAVLNQVHRHWYGRYTYICSRVLDSFTLILLIRTLRCVSE